MKLTMLFLCLSTGLATATNEPEAFHPNVWGVQLRVPAVSAAVEFYSDVLAFEPAGFTSEDVALLRSGEVHLWLARAEEQIEAPDRAHVYLNFHVDDLEGASEAVRAAGGTAGPPQEFPLGRAVDARDPFGHRFNLLEVTAGEAAGRTGIGVFNIGLAATSYSSIEPFLDSMGFEVFSRAYLPTALPYQTSGAAALVAHEEAASAAQEGASGAVLLLAVDDVESASAALREVGVEPDGDPRSSLFGRSVRLRAPDHLGFRLVERSRPQLAFERLRALEGSWRGGSTAGWEANIEVEVIAGGTVVLARSNFGAHPNDTMITAYHRDVSRLVLTHYCVAGNQPTLEAREFEGDGIAFAFAGASNIASRDEGHMDSLRMTFLDADRFQSRWSWYQQGEERWMEEIRYERERRDD